MGLVDSILLSLAVSHLALVCLYILVYYGRKKLAQLIALLCICLIAYLLGSASGEYFNHVIPDYIFRRIGNLCPILVWLISHRLFVDRRGFPSLVWLLTGMYLSLRSIGAIYLLLSTSVSFVVVVITYVVPQIIMVGFVLHSLYIAIRGYDFDLVIGRRKERIAFVGCTAGLLLLIAVNTSYLISNLVISSIGSYSFSGLLIPSFSYSVYTYVAISALVFWRFKISTSSFLDGDSEDAIISTPSHKKFQKSDTELIDKIKYAMENENLFLKNDLTVKALANHLSSQEYKVRRAINNHLQYRNFSDFLNYYRTAEAARRLKETEYPISNIGWDVGYLSLSAYHRAFKDKYGCTPREYRIKVS